MQIEIFCLCQNVRINALQQPTLINIFDSFTASQEPVWIGPFHVVASIRFFHAEKINAHFDFVVKEHEGKELVRSTEIISIIERPQPTTTYFLQSVMARNPVKFGRYNFSIEQDGKSLASTVLFVQQGNISPRFRFPVL
jgi:hypothetical protein